LAENEISKKKIAFFFTSGGELNQKVITSLVDLTPNNEHRPHFGLLESEVVSGNYQEKIDGYIKSIH